MEELVVTMLFNILNKVTNLNIRVSQNYRLQVPQVKIRAYIISSQIKKKKNRRKLDYARNFQNLYY